MRAPVPLVAALDKALQLYLQQDSDAVKKVSALNGKLLAFEIQGLDLIFFILPEDDQLHIRAFADQEPDTKISVTPAGLLNMMLNPGNNDAAFNGDMHIEGDLELGQTLQSILMNIDFDWEEHLSNIVGDIAAHKIGRGVRDFFHWSQNTSDAIQENLAEYLQHELSALPQHADIDGFLSSVDTLRSDVERIEARINRYLKQANK